jgi:hypothetical protein
MKTNTTPLDALTEVELGLFYMIATGCRRNLDGEELDIVESNLAEGLDLVKRSAATGEWLLTELGERCAAVLAAAAHELPAARCCR